MRVPVPRSNRHTGSRPRAFPLHADKPVFWPLAAFAHSPTCADASQDAPHERWVRVTLLLEVAKMRTQFFDGKPVHRRNCSGATVKTPLIARALGICQRETRRNQSAIEYGSHLMANNEFRSEMPIQSMIGT